MWSFKSEFFPEVDLVKAASYYLYLVSVFLVGSMPISAISWVMMILWKKTWDLNACGS